MVLHTRLHQHVPLMRPLVFLPEAVISSLELLPLYMTFYQVTPRSLTWTDVLKNEAFEAALCGESTFSFAKVYLTPLFNVITATALLYPCITL